MKMLDSFCVYIRDGSIYKLLFIGELNIKMFDISHSQ